MRILIADDEFTSRAILSGILRESGYETLECVDGTGAWNALQQPDAPALVILDWVMPGMDGLEVLRRLRGIETERPPYVIMVTDKNDRESTVTALDAGANDYLCKPFDAAELRARINVGRRMITLQDTLAGKLSELVVMQRRFDQIMDQSREIIWEVDAQGFYTYVSHACRLLLGYSAQDVVGRLHFNDLHRDASGQSIFRFDAAPPAFSEVQCQLLTRDGRVLDILSNALPIISDDGCYLGHRGSDRDITEIKHAASLLRQKGEELDRFFSVSPGLLCIADADGVFRKLNPEWTNSLGYALEELENRCLVDFVHPDDIADTRQALEQLRIHAQLANFANRYRHKNGAYRHIEWRFFLAGESIYAVAHDITERRLAEEMRIEASRDRFNTLLSISNDAVLILNNSGNIVEANARASELLGHLPEALKSKSFLQISTERAQAGLLGAFDILRGHQEVRFESEMMAADGTAIPVEIAAKGLLRDQTLYQVVIQDISERKHLQQYLLESTENERARLGQELHDGLCQELKALEFEATVLEGGVRRRSKALADDMGRLGDHINEAVRTAYGLAAGILPASLDTPFLADALAKLAARLSSTHDHVKFDVDVDAGICFVRDSDGNHLYRIVQEAAGNAMKHGKASHVRIECRREGLTLVLRITDNGTGIEITKQRPGGLGISVMRSRADALGGALRVRSAPAGGTEIICICPKEILREENHG